MCRIYQSLLSCGGQEERSILSFKVRWQSWKAIIKSCEKFPIIIKSTNSTNTVFSINILLNRR